MECLYFSESNSSRHIQHFPLTWIKRGHYQKFSQKKNTVVFTLEFQWTQTPFFLFVSFRVTPFITLANSLKTLRSKERHEQPFRDTQLAPSPVPYRPIDSLSHDMKGKRSLHELQLGYVQTFADQYTADLHARRVTQRDILLRMSYRVSLICCK